MDKKAMIYVSLPISTKRMGRMAAARLGIGVSEYVRILVERDCLATGISDLLPPEDDGAQREPRGADKDE